MLNMQKKCLNGWWDIQMVYDDAGEIPPDAGWLEEKYLVPSFWTKPLDGVRKKGQKYYSDQRKTGASCMEFDDFLFDAFGYPKQWSQTRSGWVRRSLDVELLDSSKRYFLLFEAIMPQSSLFVNGRKVCSHIHPTLPLEVDVTDFLVEGKNEIIICIKDYDYVAKKQANVPTGNGIPCTHSGIWQDVWLIERPEVYCSDVTVRTSTRKQEITVIFEITNASRKPRELTVSSEIVDWVKEADLSALHAVLSFPERTVKLSAGDIQCFEYVQSWDDAEWWSPDNPKLYQLRTRLTEDGRELETVFERFGFREIWIEGPDLILNDYPVHLFSDWGHKVTPYYYTEGWIRQWFSMIRDGNMNHTRLHTHPHPQLILDMADEEGILITCETGMHGSGGAQGSGSSEYWRAAEDHIRRFVRRDKNHPSVILWSVENEMRWNDNDSMPLIKKHLPKLRKLFNELDPTRYAYHDGDSSLWNERTQDIISRHYGKECAGLNWWDKTQPLHSGELSFYHNAGPNNTLHLVGDEAYSSWSEIDEATGLDSKLIVEAGRTMGVGCFGPWNQSCLANLRSETRAIELDYEDYTVPGVKPLYVPPHCSEFNFWTDGKGYTPQRSFEIQMESFRPFMVTDLSLNRAYITGEIFQREIFLVNDTLSAQEGMLCIKLSNGQQTILECEEFIIINRGRIAAHQIKVEIPLDTKTGEYRYSVSFCVGELVLDQWVRTIRLEQSIFQSQSEQLIKTRVAVFGNGSLKKAMQQLNIDFFYIASLQEDIPDETKILIMEKSTVEPGSRQNRHIQRFLCNGGRVIVMEQGVSLFPGLKMESKPVLKAFVRGYGHPLLEGVTNDDFAFWGEDSYALTTGDSYVAKHMYRKDDGSCMHVLADSGEGDFGKGDLGFCPFFELREREGLLIACQFRITDKLFEIPAAQKLLVNMFRRVENYRYSAVNPLIEADGGRIDQIKFLMDSARSGKIVMLNNISAETFSSWSEVLGVSLRECASEDVYQAVRAVDDEILSGVSNEDICGIKTWNYTTLEVKNLIVAQTVLEPTEGIEELLVTPTESGLRELMVFGGKTELLRAHTLSRFVYGKEKPKKAVVLGRIPVGDGYILINQFAPPVDTCEYLNRLSNRLRANMGYQSNKSLLEGNSVPLSAVNSPGYPQKIYIANGSGVLKKELMQAMAYTGVEQKPVNAIMGILDWDVLENPDGIWHASNMDISETMYLFYIIHSPRDRKDIENEFDLPDPEAKTFMDIFGEGEAEIIINGKSIDEVSISNGQTTVSDISLEQGCNYLLIQWKPLSPQSTLCMKWRNIMHQPETGFDFIELL